jgi:DNA (cytosine-5)-methyltransferase 1
MRPRLLDLFCGAGGAAMGYHRAGFEVVGVDINPQPHYPFEFHQVDALEYPLYGFDVVHASPPCQAYSKHVTSRSSRWVPTLGKDEPELIAATRTYISSRMYVIENVMGAQSELVAPVMLCGTMFGLPISRHRLFESNVDLWPLPGHPDCRGTAKREALAKGWDYRDMTVTGKGRRAGTADRWRELLGIDWPTTQHELAEAIPPAYTEWIGRQLLAAIARAA